MPRAIRILWCVVEGYSIEISVGPDINIMNLKERIKKKMVLHDAATKMILWKVRMFYVNIAAGTLLTPSLF